MKKYFQILIALTILKTSFGQTKTDFAEISGKVMTSEIPGLKSQPIKNVDVYLVSIDSNLRIISTTNDSGIYQFRIKRSFGKIRLNVSTSAMSSIPNNKKRYSFLRQNELSIVDITKNNIIKDFFLTPYIPDIFPPSLQFKYNSTEMYWDKSDIIWGDTSPEDAVLYYAKMLKDNPKMTVRITGYCDTREKRPKYLSSKRAKFIKTSLVKAGIDKKRIVTKGGGTKTLYITDEIINNAPTIEEKEMLHQKNRRAIIVITTFGDD